MRGLALARLAPIEMARLDLIAITNDALNETERGDDNWKFPWRAIVGQFRPYLRRFEVALWFEGQLYGLAIGRASRGKRNVTIHYLERPKQNNPFAGWIAAMVMDASDNYGKILNSQWVRIKNPLPGVIRRYETLGFSLAETIKGSTYYERRVS